MIYEFALDPAILSTWEKVRYLIEKFGCEHGRLISRFPSKWKKMVWEGSSGCAPVERKRIEESLANIDSKLLRNGRSYDNNSPWLQNAEVQHGISPFHAIISNASPNNKEFVLIESELSDAITLWNVKRGLSVPRTSSEIVKCVQPLLQASTEILFIDQHFKPSELRFRNVLAACVNIMVSNTRITRIEYHVGLNDVSRAFYEEECNKKLKPILPKGMTITIVRWEQIEGKDTLHPRYVLTDLGGIHVEHGLDEGDDGETTDIALLDQNIYAQRWEDYQRDTSPFNLVDEITVVGTRV